MDCPHCQKQRVVKNGRERLQDGTPLQRYLCQDCGKRFNERTGTPMARLRTPRDVVDVALEMRTQGMGARAAARSFGKSHSTILRWEKRLAPRDSQPPLPTEGTEASLDKVQAST